MSNLIKYKGVTYAEDKQILKTGGVLYQVKELRADALEGDSLQLTVVSDSDTLLSFRLNDKVEYFRDGLRKGVYYLQSVTRVGPKAYQLYALSAVGRLMAQRHAGGLYTGQRADAVVQEICGDIPVMVETCYASRALYGWLPYAEGGSSARSARDNLADLLLSIGAWLGTDENGVLRVEKLWDGTASTIPIGRIDSRNVQEKTDAPVSAVVVTEHQYVPSTETQPLFNGTATEGKLIIFDEPMHDLSATGFTILESGANYAVLSAGTGELTGQTYTHNTSVITRTVTAGAAENLVTVPDVYLISLVNSVDVATRLVDYYKHRTTLTVDVNPRGERAGHVVQLYHPWNKALVSACIASRETKVSSLLKSRTTALVGFVPPQPDDSQYYDQRVVLTGSGSYTWPANAVSARAVLIGGADGGYSGLQGQQAPLQSAVSGSDEVTDSVTRYNVTKWTLGGDGGEAGAGGLGGAIFSADLTPAAGQSVAYACGVGGAGGVYSADGSVKGAPGTATTFGALSSASGAQSPSGYYDPITGQTYAAPGAAGVPGSAGCGKEYVDGTGWVARGGEPITYNGQTYAPGGTGDRIEDEKGSWNVAPWGYREYYANYGLGGGPAVGANGSDGLIGTGYINNSSSYGNVYARGGQGGRGGNATPPSKESSNTGRGGTGGNGGGGGGSGGFARAEQRMAKNAGISSVDLVAAAAAQSYGGNGSDGGQGGDGCIILYLRIARPIQSGWAKDKNGKLCLDRLGKRRIV